MKNYANSKKWERPSTKKVFSDGYFKVNENVYFNTQNSFYDGNLKYLKCQIAEIRMDHNKFYKYRILIFLPNNQMENFWTSKNKLKKEILDNFIDEDKLKFKSGQKVFISYDRHYNVIIDYAETGYDNEIIYSMHDIQTGHTFKLNERYIKEKRNDIEHEKLKVGDYVSLNYGPYHKVNYNYKSEIKKIFSYDNEDTIYCDLTGHYNSTIEDRWLIKSREPLRIFSDDDPYGEEDWADDEI